ncbi:hypothetical protein QFC19_002938 [Naganishia cerealis]|uniref:Uncharacterized protein n=1 Tax=Naganishia cerealis TaxID=610337 RepID=A0ACC2W6G8_9TREE|nr:hypothetical protein QFC19_002938 [Naganishia cerealis]
MRTLVTINVAVLPSGDPGWLIRPRVLGALNAKGAERRDAAAEEDEVVGAVVLDAGDFETIATLEDYNDKRQVSVILNCEKTDKVRTVGTVFPKTVFLPALGEPSEPVPAPTPATLEPVPAPTPVTPEPVPDFVPPVVSPAVGATVSEPPSSLPAEPFVLDDEVFELEALLPPLRLPLDDEVGKVPADVASVVASSCCHTDELKDPDMLFNLFH